MALNLLILRNKGWHAIAGHPFGMEGKLPPSRDSAWNRLTLPGRGGGLCLRCGSNRRGGGSRKKNAKGDPSGSARRQSAVTTTNGAGFLPPSPSMSNVWSSSSFTRQSEALGSERTVAASETSPPLKIVPISATQTCPVANIENRSPCISNFALAPKPGTKKARHFVSKVPGGILATTYSRTT